MRTRRRSEFNAGTVDLNYLKAFWDLRLDCYQAANAVLEGRKIPFDINRGPSPSSSPCQGEADASASGEGLLEQSPGDLGEIKKIIDATCGDRRVVDFRDARRLR
jgi:hypothetical protein